MTRYRVRKRSRSPRFGTCCSLERNIRLVSRDIRGADIPVVGSAFTKSSLPYRSSPAWNIGLLVAKGSDTGSSGSTSDELNESRDSIRNINQGDGESEEEEKMRYRRRGDFDERLGAPSLRGKGEEVNRPSAECIERSKSRELES